MKDTMRMFACMAAAFLITAAVYWPCAQFSYVPQDDLDYVVDNPNVRKGLTVETAKWAFTSQRYAENCEWHPAAWLSMLADVTIAGGDKMSDAEWGDYGNRVARTMHLHNVLLHAANAALLFLLMAATAGRPAVAPCRTIAPLWLAGLALLWAVHPLRTEVVCWVSERKEALSVFFMLLSLICYTRVGAVLSFLFFALALMAKPVAVTLPAVLFAWDWVLNRKLRILRLVPFALASLGTCWMTVVSQRGALESGSSLELGARLTAIFGAPVIYIRQTFYPANLAVLYPDNARADWWAVGLGLALVLAIAALCCRWFVRRFGESRQPSPLLDVSVFGVAWVYVGLLPMLGIVKVGVEQHSDRYTYWVGCGAAVCAALVLAAKGRLWREAFVAWASKVDGRPFDWAPIRRFLTGTMGAALVVLAVATRSRAEVWRTPLSFFREAIGNCWDYSLVEKMQALVQKTGATDWEEVEGWYRECANRVPCIETNLSLARYLLTKPPVEGWLGETDRLYTEPKLLLDAILSADPNHREARELLDRIEKIRKGGKRGE